MIRTEPLTRDRWDDLLALFGERGAYSGCWCTWWRQTSAEFDANGNAGNRALLERLVRQGAELGLIGYVDDAPTGWVSVAPRPDFGRLLRSRPLGPSDEEADDADVWAITCFYIDRHARGQGVGGSLLAAAVRHAAERGARAVEGYPVDPDVKRRSNADSFTGVVSMFEAAGFREIERRKEARPIFRIDLP